MLIGLAQQLVPSSAGGTGDAQNRGWSRTWRSLRRDARRTGAARRTSLRRGHD